MKVEFIDTLTYDFVREFGEKLGLKDFHVRHDKEGWHLNFDNDNKVEYNILIGNFLVQSALGKEFCNKATKLWRKEMYGKFGDKYFKALKSFEFFNLRMKYRTEKAILKEHLNKEKDKYSAK